MKQGQAINDVNLFQMQPWSSKQWNETMQSKLSHIIRVNKSSMIAINSFMLIMVQYSQKYIKQPNKIKQKWNKMKIKKVLFLS